MVLGIVLLTVGIIGLVLTLLSLIGFELANFDVDFGDSGIGLLSVLTPFLTGFGLLGGGLLLGTHLGPVLALTVGAATGILLTVIAVAITGYLVGSEEELPSFDLTGAPVRIVEPVSPGRFGTAEVQTPLGARHVTVTADVTLSHNDQAVIVDRIDGRDGFHIAPISFGHKTL